MPFPRAGDFTSRTTSIFPEEIHVALPLLPSLSRSAKSKNESITAVSAVTSVVCFGKYLSIRTIKVLLEADRNARQLRCLIGLLASYCSNVDH